MERPAVSRGSIRLKAEGKSNEREGMMGGPLHSPAAKSTGGTAPAGSACARNAWRVGKRAEAPGRLPGPGKRKTASQWQTPDTLHRGQAFQETSLLGQQLCSLPRPSTAPSAEGQSELWQGNGVPKEKPLHPAMVGRKLSSAQLSPLLRATALFEGAKPCVRPQVSGTRPDQCRGLQQYHRPEGRRPRACPQPSERQEKQH